MPFPSLDFSAAKIDDAAAAAKYRKLLESLRGLAPRGEEPRPQSATGPAVIGFSGGVDSTLLAAAARHVLGRDGVLACLALSPSLPGREYHEAVSLAELLDVELTTYRGTEFENPAYLANGPDRCFHCKTDLFTHLRRIAAARGSDAILYGANADDGLDYRPGLRAAAEHGARAPLAEAGLTKSEIRALSRAIGLPTADKPSMPCLSSRIPYGSSVDAQKLAAVETGEALLADMGFRELRVRHEGDTARIEVPLDQLGLFEDAQSTDALVRALKAQGFKRVLVDLEGFRSGNLNAALPETVKAKFHPGSADRLPI